MITDPNKPSGKRESENKEGRGVVKGRAGIITTVLKYNKPKSNNYNTTFNGEQVTNWFLCEIILQL